ncbi:MAG: HEAT repeat domain-containing protein [Anaerolineae bacterium]|nr:HEAT repeat domain-containing protein [Anaerolineae bacterium]
MEPVLSTGDTETRLTGLEPELGGDLRVPVDSRLWQELLSRNERRIRRAADEIKAQQKGRHYTNLLELIVRNRRLAGRRHFPTRQRRSAVEAISILNEPGALSPLIDALADEDWQIRQYAAWALGEFGDYHGIDALLGALDDDSPYVQLAAADALMKFSSTRARAAINEFWATRQARGAQPQQ